MRFNAAEGLPIREFPRCATTALHSIKSRPAKVGDKLSTRWHGHAGFSASEDATASHGRAIWLRPIFPKDLAVLTWINANKNAKKSLKKGKIDITIWSGRPAL
jgi:hypothetical protein